jgi:hypothetical protein
MLGDKDALYISIPEHLVPFSKNEGNPEKRGSRWKVRREFDFFLVLSFWTFSSRVFIFRVVELAEIL